MRRILLSLFIFLLASGAWAGETWHFTILHTNDLHGMMMPFAYTRNAAFARADAGGLARRATAIAQFRKEITHATVLVDCGDLFTRGPWHTRHYGMAEIEALNLMGYELFCVGNNELKGTEGTDSQELMLKLARRSRFPWVGANLTVGETGQLVAGIHPFVVRDYNGVHVGFLGLTALRAKDYPQTKGWTISDPIEAAKHWVPIARNECDILIAVTHIGYGVDRRLAAEVPGIDAIVGGDSHTFLPAPVLVKGPAGNDVPIAQAGEQGMMLGRLDLTFTRGDDHVWRLTAVDGKLIPIDASFADDPAMQRLLERWLAPAAPEKVGRLALPAPARAA